MIKKLNFFLLIVCNIASAHCHSSLVLHNVRIYFYHHSLGIYAINLNPTIDAIKTDEADSGNPYYEKKWFGSCPGGLKGGHCIEFTVYPDAKNFSPGDIMKKIKRYTHGKPNRGEVRIITDNDETHYAYTTNHEKTFCGPYRIL